MKRSGEAFCLLVCNPIQIKTFKSLKIIEFSLVDFLLYMT